MRNVDKKWALFVVATVVCLYGICYTLVNVTFAINVLPVDDNFNDINFYKCVIDSYNSMYSLKLDYDDMMDYDKLKNLKSINCSNKEVMERDKIISLKGIELMTSLEDITLTYTNVTNMDLSNNKLLKKINLEGNVFVDNLYVYKGERVFLNDGVNLSNKIISNNITWNNQNRNILDINFYSMIYAKDNGVAVVLGESNLGYSVINNIHVVSISSLKYEIVNDKIYVDDVSNFNIQDIECNDDNVLLELHYNSLELYVKYNENILKKFVLVEGDA